VTEFEIIFDDNRELVFKYLMRLSQNPSLAEELTQDTFFRAYMNLSSLRDRGKASVWLCQIAKNTYFAWYNEHKKIDSFDDIECISSTDSIEESFLQKDLFKTAIKYLYGLDEPYKEVFMLSVFGGLSLKDISDIFGKSESWARVTFYRTKQKLLERMEK